MSSRWPGAISARVAELSSSAAPLPRISRPESTPWRVASSSCSARAAQVRVALQAALGGERDRRDDVRVGELGPGRLREVERLHAGERLAPALGGLRAQAAVDLLLGHPLELAVVVEQAHEPSLVALARVVRRRARTVRTRALLAVAGREPGVSDGLTRGPVHEPLPRVTRVVPGPWITRNQKTKPSAQTTAVIAKIRPSAPVRWSWPAARRTRIHAWSSRRSSASAPNRNPNSPTKEIEDAEGDAAREVVGLRAEPQAGERDRAPAEQAEDDHRAEQDAGERAVEALAQGAAARRQLAEADGRRAGPAPDEQAAVLGGVAAHRSPMFAVTGPHETRCRRGARAVRDAAQWPAMSASYPPRSAAIVGGSLTASRQPA